MGQSSQTNGATTKISVNYRLNTYNTAHKPNKAMPLCVTEGHTVETLPTNNMEINTCDVLHLKL